MIKIKVIEKGVSGSEIINRLRKGHVVRRKKWRRYHYIRICNERGFDSNGNAVVGDAPIYTHSTSGYFMHIGSSSQPIKRQYWEHQGCFMETRGSDGIELLFENDWEDCGFMTPAEFEELTSKLRPLIEKDDAEEQASVALKQKNRQGDTNDKSD